MFWNNGLTRGYGLFDGYGFFGFGGYFLQVILFFSFIALLVYFIVRATRPQNREIKTGNEAIEIAKLRYARGEITSDEYREIIKTISS